MKPRCVQSDEIVTLLFWCPNYAIVTNEAGDEEWWTIEEFNLLFEEVKS